MKAHRLANERGVMLMHVAVAMLALLALAALAVDYGVMWASRRQAQNAADAAALGGAVSLAYQEPGNYDRARLVAQGIGQSHWIFGANPTINLGSGDDDDITQDISFPDCPPGAEGGECIRVNIYRDSTRDPLPTFFARLANVVSQGVRATATAQIASGNQIECLLPFAVIDRWADNYDDNVEFFPNDGETGIEGWTSNDDFQPANGDVYVGPYDGNVNHTGWKVDEDYGRQLILKDGDNQQESGQYSSGWAQLVYLPGSQGGNDVNNDILQCNEAPVGIATSELACGKNDEPNPAIGCVEVKTGIQQSAAFTVSDYIDEVTEREGGEAVWDPNATGPDGLQGAVVGGAGMATERIRGIVVFDINTYMAANCSGGTCRGKVANIIGFFLEGVCQDVMAAGRLDPGMACENPNKDIVGRIIKLPSTVFGGAGEVEESASFLQVVRLVR